jgi:filamentous hemagglutinin family protein
MVRKCLTSEADWEKHWPTSRYLWLCSASIAVCSSFFWPVLLVHAQVDADGTLGTRVQTNDQQSFIVDGGLQAGSNLFHSFRNFSVPTNGSILFNTTAHTDNVFSRITGEKSSFIDGSINVQGSGANLFLLNPQGILFGPNARLNIGGSFLATTADRLDFADGAIFSASNVQADSSLLTIAQPIGLRFGVEPGTIINQSVVQDFSGLPVGLNVQPNRTLALLGGNIVLEGGALSAPGGISGLLSLGGQIILGSVGNNSLVDLEVNTSNLILDYDNVSEFKDILLSGGAVIDVNGNSSGTIDLKARTIRLTDSSEINALNLGDMLGGLVNMAATELLELNNASSINTTALSVGISGDIVINTERLILRNDSFIDASNAFIGNRGGSIMIDVGELIQIDNLSQISVQTFAPGNGGNLNITTQRLLLTDGGQITSSTRSSGDGGSIQIQATESIQIQGRQVRPPENLANNPLLNPIVPSGILAISDILVEGAVNSGDSGTISIETPSLRITNGGTISVRNTGIGQAGDIAITGTTLALDSGSITATTSSGNGGNIRLNLNNILTFRNNSTITATAGDQQFGGDGGNITIRSPFLLALPTNPTHRITANAFSGNGGNISITTNAILGSPFLRITASSQLGLNGTIQINNPILELNEIEAIDTIPLTVTIPQGCNTGGSHFTNTGHGGIPASPFELLSSYAVLEDTRLPQGWADRPHQTQAHQTQTHQTQTHQTTPKTVPEATTWHQTATGQINLVAQASGDNPYLQCLSSGGSETLPSHRPPVV